MFRMKYLNPDSPDPNLIRRGQHFLIVASCMAVITGTSTGGVFATTVALKMDASPLYIGVLQAAHLGSWALMLLTIQKIQRNGKKLLLVYGHAISLLFLVPLPFIPDLWHRFGDTRPSIPLMVFFLSLMGRHFFKGIAQTGWMPMIQDNVPLNQRGRFFGRMRTGWQSVLVVFMIVLGVFVGEDAPWHVIRLIYVCAIVGAAGHVLCLLPVREFPPSGEVMPVFDLITRPFRDRQFRWVLLYMFTYSSAIGLADQFRFVYLKKLGFDYSLLMYGSATVFLGGVLTLRLWGRLADRFGGRAMFSICHVGVIASILGWLFVSPGRAGCAWALVLLATMGIFNSGQGLAITRHLFGIIDRRQQASYITMSSIVGMATIGLAAFVGGAFLNAAEGTEIRMGSVTVTEYHILFSVSGLLFLLPHFLRRRLRHGTEAPSAEVIAFVTRPLRMMLGNIFAVVPRTLDSGTDTSEDDQQERL